MSLTLANPISFVLSSAGTFRKAGLQAAQSISAGTVKTFATANFQVQ